MLFYHENPIDKKTLDKEPLLNRDEDESAKQQRLLAAEIAACVAEYHSDKLRQRRRRGDEEPRGVMENDSDSEPELPHHLDENDNELKEQDDEIINFDPNADIKEHLLGLFVVSFDTKLGNIIEWQMPRELNLEYVEFKAMASGFHLIQNDHVLESEVLN
jgi:hypothetical protein